ncbi:MAG: LysM domain-containing protein [Acidobacteriaceae bacterium]
MSSPLHAFLQLGLVPPVTFPTDSRYYGFSTLTYTTPAGVSVSYLARRIIPQPGAPNYATVTTYSVVQGDRLDLIAAKFLGDPLLFWLICDANGAIRPGDLVSVPGTAISITMPQGIPGGSRV